MLYIISFTKQNIQNTSWYRNKTWDVKQIYYYSAKQAAEVAQSVRAFASRRVGVRIPAATNLSRYLEQVVSTHGQTLDNRS